MGRKAKEKAVVDSGSDFPKKYLKILQEIPDFIEGADAMSTEDLEREALSCEQLIFYNEQDMAKDPDLMQAKDHVKELESPFKEVINEATAKVKYITWTLQTRGQTPKSTVKSKSVLEDTEENESDDE